MTGLVVEYKTAHGTANWKTIEDVDVTGIVDSVDVQWNIDDFAALIDGGGDPRVYVRAVATNALTITDPEPAMTTIKLDSGVCPVEPEHIAVDIVPAGTNPGYRRRLRYHHRQRLHRCQDDTRTRLRPISI